MTDEEKNKRATRRRAEAIIDSQDMHVSEHLQKYSLDETKKIIHELEVHQIELKMQNEELLVVQEELGRTKKRYFDLYDMAPVGYCTLNEGGLIEEGNLAISNLLGVSRDKLIKQPLSHFIVPEEQDSYYLYRKKFFTSEYEQECELRMIKADGTPFWAHLTALGETNIVRLIIKDISERKTFEEKLKLLASVFTNAGEAIMITGLDGVISDVNETFSSITGYTKNEIIGKKPSILSSGKQSKEFYTNMWNMLITDGSWKGEIWNKRKNGELYAEMLIINTVYDYKNEPKHYVALFSDVTGIKEYENSLKNIAHYDQLTGLPNRVLLADRLLNGMIQTKRNGQSLAVIFLDLDGFKEINDTYGHEMGDKLLIALAKEMKEELREGDTLSRIGGDEFVAVLFDIEDVAFALPIINRLLESAAKKIEIEGVMIQVSASLGVTFYPQTQMVDADQLLRQADQAMYEAKLSGKNRFHIFNAEENNLIRKHYEGIEELREALRKEEFILYYQPKVNMRTGKVIGAEALIRWQHPTKGLLSPSEFLPTLEGHSLSIKIGKWVIDTALKQIELWHDKGIDIPISINIGARQLLEENFAEHLESILLQHSKVNPNMLEIEVLETSGLEDILRATAIMNACKSLGVTFSLDDFGTGYSSLTYLKQLPIKQIKIDQSFVRDMLNNPDDLSILEGIISLAEAFRYSVIAEGVETSEHAITLIRLGCVLGQGYVIAHPMPQTDFTAWLKEHKPNPLWENQHLMNSAQRQLFFVKVKHRAWVANVKAILNNEKHKYVKAYGEEECYFGQWLEQDGTKYLGMHYKEIDSQHKNIHIFADRLLDLYRHGQTEEALAGLDKLDVLGDELITSLSVLENESI